MSTIAPRLDPDDVPSWLTARALAVAAAVLLVEAVAVVAYYARPSVTLLQPRYAVYGLAWVNVGLFVLATARVSPAPARTRRRAAVLAAGYLAVLAYTGGLVSVSLTGGGMATGVRVALLPPGWGPALLYSGSHLSLVLMPARVVGYLALAYLVYGTVVDASSAGIAGLLGLLSCVSCTWPVIASVVAAVAGGGSALAATALGVSYDLSTLVFLVTVGLLYWRPVGR